VTADLVPLPKDLAPEPTAGTGALIGYARVSTSGQNLDRQMVALTEAGCIRVFADKLSGKDASRPELQACLDYLRPGDTLVVASLDRLSRSLQDLITTVAGLRRRGTGFKSLHEALDTTTPGGRLVFHVFAALAEFIRELIVEGTHEGLSAARGRGVRLGRPPALTAEQIRHARDLLARPENTVSSIARLLGVSRSTIYKYVPEIARAGLPADTRPLPDVAKYDQLLPSRHADPGLPAAVWTRYQSRPGRRALVAASLADLRGPTKGTMELPLRLFWSGPDRTFDLGDPAGLRSVYEIVLGEAIRAEELAYLNGDKLAEVWRDLYLPKGVRQAWEEQHPVLRAATVPAA
jgi:DNA invertase Pin-like site-specific DNA recombinase